MKGSKMKQLVLTILTLGIMLSLSGCASTSKVYEQTDNLKYTTQPTTEDLETLTISFLRHILKDPDSLKNITFTPGYKCYASKMGMTDNISPKYDYGYWCYTAFYQATNSYGGYVRGEQFIIFNKDRIDTPTTLDETVRKSDDIWTYNQPII